MNGWSPSTGSPATISGSRCSWPRPGRGSPPSSGMSRRQPAGRVASPVRGGPGRAGPGRLGRRGRPARPCRDRQGLLVPHGAVVLAGPVLLFHHQQGSGHVLGLPPAGVRALRRGARQRSSTTAPRPWSAATSRRGRRCRCIRRRPRSPTTTASPSTCWPPTGRPGRAGSSGRSRSSATMCWPGAASTRIAELDGAFARLAADPPRPGAPHPRPGHRASAPRPTGPRCGRCRTEPYLVAERHLRRVGKDCLISFEATLLLGAGPPGPARAAGPAQRAPRPGHGDRIVITALDRRRRRLAGHPSAGGPAAAPGSSTRPTGTGCPTATPAPPSSTTPAPPAGRLADRDADRRPPDASRLGTDCRTPLLQPRPSQPPDARPSRRPTAGRLLTDRPRQPVATHRPHLKETPPDERPDRRPDPRPRHPTRPAPISTDTITELVDRAETDASWATSTSSTCCSRRKSGSARAAGSATR